MEKILLGNSDMMITKIGLGTWAIGGPWEYGWGHQEDVNSIRTIHKALDHGINWIDTAAVYGLGHSEEVIGRVLKERSNNPYIFSKCSIVWDKRGRTKNSLKADSIREEIEASLKRMNVDVIDLYQIHWPNPEQDIEEGWETLARLKQEGKVRYIGVSNFSVSQMQKIRSIAPITSLQPPYSLLNRSVEEKILPYCLKQNIGVIVYSPMSAGLLTGKMTRERIKNLPPDDWRIRSEEFKEPRLSHNLKLVELMRDIAENKEFTIAEVAIAWTLKNPAVTAAIVGMRSPNQIEGVIHAPEITLDNRDIECIEIIVDENP